MPDLDLLRTLAPPVEPAAPATVARARRRSLRRRRRRPVLLATPVAVGVAILALVFSQLGGEPTFAAATVKAAQGTPRLLVDGWKVTRVDEWDGEQGEMTFADGWTLDLRWGPGLAFKEPMERVGHASVVGRRVPVARYPGSNDFVAVWGGVMARGVAPSRDAFVAALERIERVSAEAWLSALPESAVTPRARAGAIDAMLKGIPLPPGFKAPKTRAETRDRYQLGARVAGAVTCAWIARWMDGDTAAVAALASSRRWPLLLEMNAEGDFPEVVWQYADAVAGKAAVPAGKLGLTVDETYKEALGC